MKKLLEYIIRSLVENPKDVVIEEKEEGDYLTLVIKVHPEDIKIVIGKKGQTIKAIRELAKIKAIGKGKKINIKIEE
ncbi:MAG: KH domain-containing protein [Microgenomates group bacterium]